MLHNLYPPVVTRVGILILELRYNLIMTEKNNTFINWLYQATIFVGIVGSFLFFVNYGMGLLYPAPEYEDFCGTPTVQAPTVDMTQQDCEDIGGRWRPHNQPKVPSMTRQSSSATVATSSTTSEDAGYCDRDYTCRKAFSAAEDRHDRASFLILVSLGLLVAGYSLSRRQRSILHVSLAASGVLLILTATARFWNQAQDWLQFVLLFVVLLVFVYAGYERG